MKFLDEYRDPQLARQIAATLERTVTRPWRIMEICGGQTHSILRFGIDQILPPHIPLISGPGCPVCVTDPGYIDVAIALAERGAIIATFGDMVRVPGSSASLTSCRAAGGDVRVCYSPSAALDLARNHPQREVVFLAVGFETTIAPVVSLVHDAVRDGLGNLSLLTAFKMVPPALRALLADPDIQIDAFLCPAHVSAIIGSRAYAPFAADFRVPCVVAGFEPLDILNGVHGILEQTLAHEAKVENQYARVVRPGGNPKAQERIAR
jgi:hydrogenase expression/formation protein HypD